MEVEESVKFMLQILELLYTNLAGLCNQILGYLGRCVLVIFISPMTQCVVSTFHDCNTCSLLIYAVVMNVVIKTSSLAIYREDVKFLLRKIAEIINIKIKCYRDMKHYVELDRSTDGMMAKFSCSIVGTEFLMMFGPVIREFMHYARIMVTKKTPKLPVKYPSAYEVTPAHALIFAFNILLYFLAYTLASVDGVFMSISLNSIACLCGLSDVTAGIDGVLAESFIEHLAKINRLIIDGQDSLSLTELCTLALDLFMNENRIAEEVYMMIVCMLNIIIVYCNYGKELTALISNVFLHLKYEI